MKQYTKHWGLFRNKAVTKEIQSLDPVTDHCRMVHLIGGYEFPWDLVRALEVALMRTFCSPKVSGLLHRTGEFKKYGQKRYDDTALLVAEFVQNGYDSERGRKAIEHTNKIHGFYHIGNEEFLFVLSTFVLEPIKWLEAYGWRPITEKERLAFFYFFKEVGERMHIKNIPPSLAGLKQFVEEYERENFVLQPSNHAVGNATVHIVKGWMPAVAKPFVLPVMKCLMEEKMMQALGYTPPAKWLKALVKGAMKLRAFFLRKITFKKYPSFVTIEPNRTYPKGYEIEQLGPPGIVKNLA